jgi:hypothetical protein
MQTKQISDIADEALSNYDFGEDVTVEAVNGWNYDSSSTEAYCTVFIKFAEDSFEDDTHAANFTVDIKDGKVIYAGASYNGESLGKIILE